MDLPVEMYFFWLIGVFLASWGILVPSQHRDWSPSRLQVSAYVIGMVLGAGIFIHLLDLKNGSPSRLTSLDNYLLDNIQLLISLINWSLLSSIALLYPVGLSCFVQRLLALPRNAGSVT